MSQVTNWRSVQGAQINLNTLSIYLNDRWQLNDRVDVQPRRAHGAARHRGQPGRHRQHHQHRDRPAPGRHVRREGRRQVGALQGTYGHYAGKASETQFADNTNVGTPSQVVYTYQGPAGQGIGFAPAFSLANYRDHRRQLPRRRTCSSRTTSNTPLTKEWTLQAGTRLGQPRRGEGRLRHRKTTNFLEDFITIDNGKTAVTDGGVSFGTFDNEVIRNTDDIHRREYQGLLFILPTTGSPPTGPFGANYTHQIRNDGELRGRGGEPAGQLLDHRRPARVLQRGAALPVRPHRRLPAAQGAGVHRLRHAASRPRAR